VIERHQDHHDAAEDVDRFEARAWLKAAILRDGRHLISNT
jgi:hypothetical protein